MISIIFRLDGNPHEIIIKDTKYYVKELYSADKKNTSQLSVSLLSISCLLTMICVGSAGTCSLAHKWTFSAKTPF